MSKIKKKFKPRKGSKRLIVRGTEYACMESRFSIYRNKTSQRREEAGNRKRKTLRESPKRHMFLLHLRSI